MTSLAFLDVFAGIGGFRMGMEIAGHKCAGYVEIDKYARRSYEAIYDTAGEWTAEDIRSISDSDIKQIGRKINCVCAGFPCQPYSIAGRQRGFEDPRGSLFFHLTRVINLLKPPVLLFENVKHLLSHGRGDTFKKILITLDELGYDVEWQVLDSADFRVPQHRERLFIIGHLRGRGTGKIFPLKRKDRSCNPVPIKIAGHIKQNYECTGRIYSPEGISPTLDSCQGGNRQPKILLKKTQEGTTVRRLTPREFWRLQGFPDWAFDRVRPIMSDSQLYKQAGNSVSVPVVEAIARRLSLIDFSGD